jgi:hypothetical protein
MEQGQLQLFSAIPVIVMAFINSKGDYKDIMIIKHEEHIKENKINETASAQQSFDRLFNHVEETYREEGKRIKKDRFSGIADFTILNTHDSIHDYVFQVDGKKVTIIHQEKDPSETGEIVSIFLHHGIKQDEEYYKEWKNRKEFYKDLVKVIKKKQGINVRIPKY